MEAEQVTHLQKAGVEPTNDQAKYTWYENVESEVVAVSKNKQFLEQLSAEDGVVGLVVKATSFYAESGGQVADHGVITVGDARCVRWCEMMYSFDVTGAMSYGGYVVHIGSLESGVVKVGDHCTCAVDYDYRFLVAPNHTMTHLMNWAIRRVLKTDVDQKGSLVDEAKLRFDFNSTKAVSPAQLAEIETLVNERINAALPVYTEVAEIAKAREICSLRAVLGEVCDVMSDE